MVVAPHSSRRCLLLADDFTEELLNQHEAEVKVLEKYYEDHKELFEGVTKWQDNWTLYLELDVSLVLSGFEGGGVLKANVLMCECVCVLRKRQTTHRGSTTEAETC